MNTLYVSKRVAKYMDVALVRYLESLAESLVKNPIPAVLSTGEKLGCDAAFSIRASYFMPGDELGLHRKNDNAEFAWFDDTKCFDLVSKHTKENEMCKP